MVWLSFSVPCPSVMSNSFVTPQTVAHQAPLIHGILQARILEWVPISCFRGSSEPRDRTHIFCIGRQILYYWATWEAPIWLSNWTILIKTYRHDFVNQEKKKKLFRGKKIQKISWCQTVQSLSHVWLFATLWTAARQVSLSITNSRTWLKLMSIELVMPSNHLILYHPLLLPASIFPSIRVFSNESVLCIR